MIGVGDNGALVGLYAQEAEIEAKRLERIANRLMPGRCMVQIMPLEGDRAIIITKVLAPKDGDSPTVDPNGRLFVREGSSIILDNAPFAHFVHGAVTPKPNPAERFAVFVAISFRSEEEPGLIYYGKDMEKAAARSKLKINLELVMN